MGRLSQAERNTVVFYRGQSPVTGDPIVGVLTGLAVKSANPKTGPMLQAYILRPDMTPTEAIETGGDRAICGDCQLRGDGVHGRGCYVTWWQAPKAIQEVIHERPFIEPWQLRDRLLGRWVRIGAYGDPAMIPLHVWAQLLSRAGGWVGYTQRWAVCDPAFQFYLMASVHDAQQQAAAQGLGWKTYRTRLPGSPLLPGEAICPASNEAGHKLVCQDCGICQGVGVKRPNAAIVVHGKPGNLHAFGTNRNAVLKFYRAVEIQQGGGIPGGLIGGPALQSSPPQHRSHPTPAPATGTFGIGSRSKKPESNLDSTCLRAKHYKPAPPISPVTRAFIERIRYGPIGRL